MILHIRSQTVDDHAQSQGCEIPDLASGRARGSSKLAQDRAYLHLKHAPSRAAKLTREKDLSVVGGHRLVHPKEDRVNIIIARSEWKSIFSKSFPWSSERSANQYDAEIDPLGIHSGFEVVRSCSGSIM